MAAITLWTGFQMVPDHLQLQSVPGALEGPAGALDDDLGWLF